MKYDPYVKKLYFCDGQTYQVWSGLKHTCANAHKTCTHNCVRTHATTANPLPLDSCKIGVNVIFLTIVVMSLKFVVKKYKQLDLVICKAAL